METEDFGLFGIGEALFEYDKDGGCIHLHGYGIYGKEITLNLGEPLELYDFLRLKKPSEVKNNGGVIFLNRRFKARCLKIQGKEKAFFHPMGDDHAKQVVFGNFTDLLLIWRSLEKWCRNFLPQSRFVRMPRLPRY